MKDVLGTNILMWPMAFEHPDYMFLLNDTVWRSGVAQMSKWLSINKAFHVSNGVILFPEYMHNRINGHLMMITNRNITCNFMSEYLSNEEVSTRSPA